MTKKSLLAIVQGCEIYVQITTGNYVRVNFTQFKELVNAMESERYDFEKVETDILHNPSYLAFVKFKN